MNYKINLGAWNSVFAVPCDVTDKHLKLANGEYVKILLYFLRHAGEDLSCEVISEFFKTPVSNVYDALLYWQNAGVLSISNGEITPSEIQLKVNKTENTEPAKETIKKTAKEQGSQNNIYTELLEPETVSDKKLSHFDEIPPRPSASVVAERATSSPEVKMLLSHSESILSKMLTPNDAAEILWFHDCLGLEVDIILMLLKYCSNIEKTNLAYITKVAINWWQNEINTHKKAKDYITKLENANKNENAVKNLFGINLRSLTKKEKQFIEIWFNQMNFNIDIVEKAYENCVDNTGKMSFPYINKTLEAWSAQGFDDVLQIEADMNRHKQKNTSKKQKSDSDTSLDLNEFDKLVANYIPDFNK